MWRGHSSYTTPVLPVQAQVADEVERERREWRRAQARRREEKQAKHERMARAVVRDAVGLALMHAVHREQCGLDVPPKVAREWVAMFHAQDVRLRSADEQVWPRYMARTA